MMKFKNLLCLSFFAFVFASCQKNEAMEISENYVSESVLAQIKNLGFNAEGVQKIDEGYLVEGDIVLSSEFLKSRNDEQVLRIAEFEQYHTSNLVKNLPRTITISVDKKLGSKYATLARQMTGRYNALNLSISMQVVSGRGNIHFSAAPLNAQYLASAGFPNSKGDPYSSVKINNAYLDRNNWNDASIVSIMAHEAGHCIGFRHTDYMSRQYSCNGSPYNEGAGSVGAIHIPGTPTGPDNNSWMLACIGTNEDRPFNNNDKVALNYLY